MTDDVGEEDGDHVLVLGVDLRGGGIRKGEKGRKVREMGEGGGGGGQLREEGEGK